MGGSTPNASAVRKNIFLAPFFRNNEDHGPFNLIFNNLQDLMKNVNKIKNQTTFDFYE